MSPERFEEIKKQQLAALQKDLPATLTYHNVFHTMDVLKQAEQIAYREGIAKHDDLLVLKTAALFHDTGFLYTYTGHEMKSCEIVRSTLHELCSRDDLDTVCSLIMATKIPQTPLSHLAQILCDADLDYLGRDDFWAISNTLRLEFLHYSIVQNNMEWEEKQLSFLLHHKYFTVTSRQLREGKKKLHIEKLIKDFSSATATD